jgi:hypothetical protein
MYNFTKENSVTNKLYLLLLFFLGIAQIFDFFLPIKLFGLSIFITIVPYLVTLFMYVYNHSYFKVYKLYLLYIFTITCLITFVLRSFFYNEDIFLILSAQRYFLFIPIFLLLTHFYFINKSEDKNIKLILYLIFFIHTTNSFLFIVGLPTIENIDKLADDYIEFSRFTGIMGGANVQASFISLIYCLLIFSEIKMNFTKFILVTFFAIIGIAPTVSRGSIFIIFLVFFYYLYIYFISTFKLYKIFIFFLIILIFSKIISIIINSEYNIYFSSFFDRFDSYGFDTGRSDKNVYFLKTINSDWVYYFLGIPIKFQSYGLNGYNSISDNSFTLVFSNFGIFCGCFFLFLIIIFTRINKLFKSKISFFYLLLLLIIIYNNNAIIWTAWTAYAILGLFYLRNKQILLIN